jgi:hypothetical protein
MTHPNRILCGPPNWNFIIRYRGKGDKIQELNLIALDKPKSHRLIAATIRDSCTFERVVSIHRTPAVADFVKKDYPMDVSYFESLY